jgi:hypothetical protein
VTVRAPHPIINRRNGLLHLLAPLCNANPDQEMSRVLARGS